MSKLQANPEDVRHAYRLLLGRDPDPDGFRHNCELVAMNGLTTVELAQLFMDSTEYRGIHTLESHGFAEPPTSTTRLGCCACVQAQIESPTFRYWTSRLRERPGKLHRKLWEWSFIAQALHERGFLNPGMSGLGFAVGTEPLASLFASMGCRILATDLSREQAADSGWVTTNQNAASLEDLNQRQLCPAAEFSARTSFRSVDMRSIPSDLAGFDFLWSSCAMEHLGSLAEGTAFVASAMRCLRPGGIAIHTTEFNCDSNDETIELGGDVVYRKKDLESLAATLRQGGHTLEPFDFQLGSGLADGLVAEPPYRGTTVLKLRIGGFVSTSFGLIITRKP